MDFFNIIKCFRKNIFSEFKRKEREQSKIEAVVF